MENILSQFTADNLEIKLTSEKLFINTNTSNETFALRSVNGIGVVDLVDEYNKALTLWKSQKGAGPVLYFFGGFFLLIALIGISKSPVLAMICLLFSALFFRMGFVQSEKSKNNEPKLMSAVRIMMSGGNRDFQFDKTGIKSGNIAEFVANVESTLTAYHKHN
jgi:hypothetical protein